MSERLETLKKARERMMEDRDTHAKVLAAPFDRDKAERARTKFIEIQALIDALDRAISRGNHFRKKLSPEVIISITSSATPIRTPARNYRKGNANESA